MDLLDVLGYGVCHREPARSLDGAWLCHRCTGLYLGGLVGVLAAGRFARGTGLAVQLLICALFIVPMGIDGSLLGRGSPMDHGWWRLLTGLAAGIGSGLFLGARAAGRVALPHRPASWAWVGAGIAAIGGAFHALGWPLPLDGAVFAGLVALCAAGSAWALHLARRVAGRFISLDQRPFPLTQLALLVVCELAVVSAIPPAFKPSLMMFKALIAGLRDIL